MSARNNDFPPPEEAYSSSPAPVINIADILGTLRRGWRYLLAGGLIGLAAAVSYILYTPTLYRSSARILIDTSVSRYLQSNKIVDEPTFHQAEIGSQLYILSSESVVVPVIRSLKLAQDAEFVGPPNAGDGAVNKLKKIVKQLIGWNANADVAIDPEAALERTAIENFFARLSVYREDVANVINVNFASADPNKAALIANAMADAYIATTSEAKFRSTNIIGQWLQDRLKELKEQAIQADRTLQEYKIANNLVSNGKAGLGNEDLSRLNLQLTDARIAMVVAKARLDRIEQMGGGEAVLSALESDIRLINESGKTGAGSLSFALNNTELGRLRSQYRDLTAKATEITSRVGPQHTLAVKLNKQLDELRSSIRSEEQRIYDSYANEYQMAKAREGELAAALTQVVGESETSSQAQVKMRELESLADAVRSLYNSFLQKFNEISTIQSQTIPVQDARIVTRAAPQLQKSYRKPAAVLAGGIVLGLLLGAGAAVGREWAADVFRTPKVVEQATDKTCVLLPLVEPKRERKGWYRTRVLPIEEFILDAPYSRFTETLRNVKALIDTGHSTHGGGKVIGVVSSVAKEGKTTIAANLAALMIASAGARTLVIDADLHRRLLTAALAPDAREGLIEALEDPSQLVSFITKRERSGLDVLPCALSSRIPNAAELLGSPRMEELLIAARKTYDYIIIEIAPIMSVVDVKLIERFVDCFIFVVEWGQTKRSLVLEALSEAPNIRERVTGIVLNKANPAALRTIEAYKGARFGNYYEE